MAPSIFHQRPRCSEGLISPIEASEPHRSLLMEANKQRGGIRLVPGEPDLEASAVMEAYTGG